MKRAHFREFDIDEAGEEYLRFVEEILNNPAKGIVSCNSVAYQLRGGMKVIDGETVHNPWIVVMHVTWYEEVPDNAVGESAGKSTA
jgi:hypothetical protein